MMPPSPYKQPVTDQGEKSPWIPLDKFIENALYHPQSGYYQKKNPFGAKGDFITSPEISSLFGEMISIWCLNKWQEAGSPLPIHLIELGPGRGLLTKDILNLFSKLSPKLFPNKEPDFLLKHTSCHLIEISQRLQQVQRETLKNYNNVYWHESIHDISEGYTFIIANEFFDALPIKQYIQKASIWHERGVIISPQENAKYLDIPCDAPPLRFTPDEEILCEICPLESSFVDQMSKRLRDNGGASIIIDYGDFIKKWQGDTLQALMNHEKIPVLNYIGNTDITHHVDFWGIAKQFQSNGIICHPLKTQGDFLQEQGIELRANQLAKSLIPTERGQLLNSIFRLISPREMGQLFKVLCVEYSIEQIR